MRRRLRLTEDRGAVSGMDPAELWRQWMESGSKAWSEMAGTQGQQFDPYGPYRRWLEGVREMQERMIRAVPEPVAGNPGVNDLWRRWFELSADSWKKSAEMGQNAMEVLPRWMQMLDEARTNLLAGGAPPSDPLQLATQWYNATSGPFSDFVGDVIEREEFLEPSSRFLQSYASFYKVFKRNSEEYLKNLQLAALEGAQNGGGAVAETNGSATEVSATDAARRKARELGVDLSEVEGTGDGGLVTVEDVRRKEEN